MKIVIDIPDEIYEKYMDDRTHATDVLHAVRNGTILPEQQPCEDCISREAVIKHICESKECYKDECKGRLYKRCYDLQWIYDLPSVTPTTSEKETVEDCISRQAVLDIINFEDEWLFDAKSHNADTKIAFSTIKSKISEMPSVTPTYDLDEYSTKLWKLAHERGKADSEG